jgi:hypothetical protein
MCFVLHNVGGKGETQMKNRKTKVKTTKLEHQEKNQSCGYTHCGTISPMKYFLVKVKMGHVGRDKYLPMNLPIRARDMKEAVLKARQHGGVKRNHKDWCLGKPKEILYEEYQQKKSRTYGDEYWQGETRTRLYLFEDRLEDEVNYRRENGIKTNIRKYIKTKDKAAIKYKVHKNKLMMRNQIEIDYEFGVI